MRYAWMAWVCLAAGTALAQSAGQTALDARLATLETLIERSSAARQIEASGTAAAVESRAQARAMLRQAREAAAAGDAERAEKLGAQARAKLVEAVRLAAPEQVGADKARADYDSRLRSTQALLAAHQRVSAEKGEAQRSAETTRAIERLLDSAAQLRAQGRMEEARRDLEQAYLIAKASVSALRSGDTLLRSLSFATKEEEYRYEVDRNDTHQMLIGVLLGGQRQAPALDAMVAQSVERARGLRARAEANASRGEHAAAVKLLEESTGELVKAIRNAGVYIPG